MRKAVARGSGANKSAVRIGLVVVCVGLGREFEARLGTGSLVWGQEGRTPAGSGEAHQGGELELWFHAAAPTRKGGERSWSWAAVSLSMTTMRPPHLGHSQSVPGFWFGRRWRYCAEELQAKRQESGAPPVGEEAKVADADEAFGQQVQEEAAQELIER